MKVHDIRKEIVATAVSAGGRRRRFAPSSAHESSGSRGSTSSRARFPEDVARRVDASLEEARLLGEDHGVEVNTGVVRARSIGYAIVEEARVRDVDLIVLGSAPRWRRQSRFFSPTVDFVLRRAPCEVLVVAFPDGVFEDEGAPPGSRDEAVAAR